MIREQIELTTKAEDELRRRRLVQLMARMDRMEEALASAATVLDDIRRGGPTVDAVLRGSWKLCAEWAFERAEEGYRAIREFHITREEGDMPPQASKPGCIRRSQWISRADLRNHPDWLYVFGDNMARRGLGGQAAQMRGEPNAVGIPTKWLPMSNEAAYFTDDDLTKLPILHALSEAFTRLRRHLMAGGTIVIPADGIGTGYAHLDRRAPKLFALIQGCLKDLESFSARG
jgi:hypothetical protein